MIAVITAEGKATDIHVVKGLGLGLDEKAIEAVRTWRFRPAMRNGDPVALQTVVMIPFRPVRKPGF